MEKLTTTVVTSKYAAGEFVQYRRDDVPNSYKFIGEITHLATTFDSPPDPHRGFHHTKYWIMSNDLEDWVDEDQIICVLNTEKR